MIAIDRPARRIHFSKKVMVGVPGRSKACRTCKRRRVGCDLREPSCGPCSLSSLPCGYDRSRIFINSGKTHWDATTRDFVPQSYSKRHRSSSKTRRLSKNVNTFWPLTVSASLRHSLERTAWESKYFEFYWANLLPNGQAFAPQAAQYSTINWINVVQDLCQRDDNVHQALLANAMSMFGQHITLRSMIVEAWHLYGKTLYALAQSLQTITGQDHDRLLAISALLAAYELLQVAEGRRSWIPASAWLRHASGEKAIILAQGPESYRQGNAHRLFVDSRLHLIYADIHHRKRSHFSSREWKSIPWALHPKSPRDKLLDILVEVPAILEDLEELLRCSSQDAKKQTALHQQTLGQCWFCDEQLQSWSTTLGSPTITFVDAIISTQDGADSMPSSEAYAMAHLGLIYWATCGILYHILWYLAGDGRKTLPEHINPRQYCRKIALIMPFLQSRGMGALFINIAAFPVSVAVGFLARQDPPGEISEEHRLLLRAFEGNYGPQLQNFLGSWPWWTARERELIRSASENT